MATNKTKTKKESAPAIGTSFSDRICNLVPSTNTGEDWSYQDSLDSGALAAPAKLPASVDLRAKWWSIGDQLNTGSCVGWATADGIVRHHMVQANRMKQSDLLSTRFVWMASKETDEFNSRPQTFIEEAGTSLKAALDVVRKYGVVLDALLPFKINTLMHPGKEIPFYAEASTRKIAGYFNLKKNLSQWRSRLAEGGPILAGLKVDATWENAAATTGKLEAFQPTTFNGGHAVCVVGYTETHFIIRNSWGTAWGDKGFGYASEAYIQDAFFDEAYVVTL